MTFLAMTEIIERTDENFAVYSGDDGLTLPALAVGANGVISVAAHVIGNDIQAMIAAFRSGDTKKKAQRLHQFVLRITKALFMAPNPTAVKAAMQMLGTDAGSVRLPLAPLSESEQKQLSQIVQSIPRQ
ncbi:hypothetical protein GCM10020331_048730 [Ectobacillus funiculus]